MTDTIIYEMHVRGFTNSPTSGVEHPGTFSGVIEKIPYLKELGVTAVELLPVFAFDEREVRGINPIDGSELRNFWGYSPLPSFAPQASYCVEPRRGLADHRVPRHGQGAAQGRDRGDPRRRLQPHRRGQPHGPDDQLQGPRQRRLLPTSTRPSRQYYMDYSGCGNTVNANHPIVEKFILDCLHYWVEEMHVDGFRFDEGSDPAPRRGRRADGVSRRSSGASSCPRSSPTPR